MNENMALTESTYYILLALAQPRHGYGIMQQTEQLSGGRVRLAAGTLYGALNALCEKGWIVPVPAQEESRRRAKASCGANWNACGNWCATEKSFWNRGRRNNGTQRGDQNRFSLVVGVGL